MAASSVLLSAKSVKDSSVLNSLSWYPFAWHHSLYGAAVGRLLKIQSIIDKESVYLEGVTTLRKKKG